MTSDSCSSTMLSSEIVLTTTISSGSIVFSNSDSESTAFFEKNLKIHPKLILNKIILNKYPIARIKVTVPTFPKETLSHKFSWYPNDPPSQLISTAIEPKSKLNQTIDNKPTTKVLRIGRIVRLNKRLNPETKRIRHIEKDATPNQRYIIKCEIQAPNFPSQFSTGTSFPSKRNSIKPFPITRS